MTNRYRTYDVPHKGLRNAFSQLVVRCSATDYTNGHDVEELAFLADDVFRFLHLHAHAENDVVLAQLEERLPGSTAHDRDDHDDLHVLQHELETLLADMRGRSRKAEDVTTMGQTFADGVHRLVARHLEHMSGEETTTQVQLWQHFTDEELHGHAGIIMSKHAPEELLMELRFIVPALSHPERVGLLSTIQAMAPEPFVRNVFDVVRNNMTTKDFTKLEEALSANAA